jgi:hypothetical protein
MTDPFDAANARLAAFQRAQAMVMAQTILDEDRGNNFGFSMLALLWRIADGRTIPNTGETRRLTSAYARWDRAGQRLRRTG